MSSLAIIRSLRRRSDGAAGAEFAMVLPLLILLLLGMIDVGRYMWALNEVEKATQMGARMAVVTTMVPTDLANANFGTTLGQGAVIPTSSFGGMQCTSNGTTASCSCVSNCAGIGTTADTAAFNRVADRMILMANFVRRSDVTIRYDNSGLGYAGDPNGPDVAPIVTVSAAGVPFRPAIFMFFGGRIVLPTVSASLTLEDGAGNFSN
jgi:Flp pilus assembly protein TadG